MNTLYNLRCSPVLCIAFIMYLHFSVLYYLMCVCVGGSKWMSECVVCVPCKWRFIVKSYAWNHWAIILDMSIQVYKGNKVFFFLRLSIERAFIDRTLSVYLFKTLGNFIVNLLLVFTRQKNRVSGEYFMWDVRNMLVKAKSIWRRFCGAYIKQNQRDMEK